MKNFLISVLLGLLLGLLYLGALAIIISPLLFFFKEGFIGIMLGTVNVTDFIRNVLGRSQGMPYRLDPYSLTIIIVQIALFVAVCVTAFCFLSRVMKELLTGEGEEYFRMFYKIIFFILFFVPEILIFLSLFFKFPVIRTITIVGIIIGAITTFATIITAVVLPDVIKNRDAKYILEAAV